MAKMMAMLEGGFGSSKNKDHTKDSTESNFKEFTQKRQFKRVMNKRPSEKPT